MSTADRSGVGLDPAHILSVASQAIRGGLPGECSAVPVADGVRLSLPTRLDAADAAPALTRVGYHVRPADGSGYRDLLVTGWDAGRLEARLTAMRAVLHQLTERLESTPGMVTALAGSMPGSLPASQKSAVLAGFRRRLRSWVTARSGIHAPLSPAIVPADIGIALRVRLTQSLETAIDDLIDRHAGVAGQALDLINAGRQPTSGDQARQAEPEFPTHNTGAATDAALPPAARPAGRHFPGARPGPHR